MVQMSVLTAQQGRWETRSLRTGRSSVGHVARPKKAPLNGGESDEARSPSRPCLPLACPARTRRDAQVSARLGQGGHRLYRHLRGERLAAPGWQSITHQIFSAEAKSGPPARRAGRGSAGGAVRARGRLGVRCPSGWTGGPGITARRSASRLGAVVAHVFGHGKSPAHRFSGDGDRTARVHDRGDRPAGARSRRPRPRRARDRALRPRAPRPPGAQTDAGGIAGLALQQE